MSGSFKNGPGLGLISPHWRRIRVPLWRVSAKNK